MKCQKKIKMALTIQDNFTLFHQDNLLIVVLGTYVY